MSRSARRVPSSTPPGPATGETPPGTASPVAAETLSREIAALADENGDENGDGSPPPVRAAVQALLKRRIADARTVVERQLHADGAGLACAARLSALQDAVIRAVVDFATTRVFGAADAERMAVVAVGGYGRGTLAPGSDVDLLFLLPNRQTPDAGERIVEYLLYMLWDLGFKVGHATRSVEDCVRLAKADMTIRTSILERRLVCGDLALFDELSQRFQKEVVEGTGREFIAAKLAERDARHKKSGDSRYLVEPNVKEGKGGLRDLHTLFWIAKDFYRAEGEAALVAAGVFSRAEAALFGKAADFLWAVRCHMHFLAGKAEERLSFDIQPEIAARLGYNTHPGLTDVERFMKHYFLIAKDVGDLTGIFCAALEDEQAKESPGVIGFVRSLRDRARKIPGTLDFRIDHNRITVANREVFVRDPVNLLRIFALAAGQRLEYHPDALKLIRRSLRLVTRELRENPEANKLFLDVLTDPNDPELHLRRMSEAGLLGRFIPDFGRIVSMMQFNMYHHYTVDEHLLRSVGILSRIERGELGQELPMSTEIVETLRDRVPLFVALLLHDVAKGRPEDHSAAGARLAAALCPRLGLDERETELVSWLVADHLAMSMTAQQRDLGDRKTILDFAEKVMTLDRLKLLTVLTVCDIRAVGPGVWNGWKGQLLRTLYFETEPVVTGGFSQTSRAKRLEAAKAALAARLDAWTPGERERYIDLHYPNYFLSVPIEDQLRHAGFVREADRAGEAVAIAARTDAFTATTEITVLCPDHPRLLSTLTGGCAAVGANIAGAQIFTMADGRALDVINLNRAFADDADEMRRAHRIEAHVRGLLGGRERMPSLMAQRGAGRESRTFTVPPQVAIDNRLSNQFTVVEVEGLDRPGILSDVTGALADLSLDIRSAHISTYGEKVVDVFYVTDLTGMKVTSPSRIERTVRRLTAVFEAPEGEATSAAVMPSDRAFGISDAR